MSSISFSYNYPEFLAVGGTTTGAQLYSSPSWYLTGIYLEGKGFSLSSHSLFPPIIPTFVFENPTSIRDVFRGDAYSFSQGFFCGLASPPDFIYPSLVTLLDISPMFMGGFQNAQPLQGYMNLIVNPIILDPSNFLIQGRITTD